MIHTTFWRSISIITVLIFISISFVHGQRIDTIIPYDWQVSTRFIFTGEDRPVITTGDSVTLLLSGTTNLRPWVQVKKKGGFLGIGAKRYKEMHDNILDVSQVTVFLELLNTKFSDNSKSTIRSFTFTEKWIADTEDIISSSRNEYLLAGFLNEVRKSPGLGWSRINLTVKIESIGRIKYLLGLLDKEKPRTFPHIQKFLELGNLAKQHPNEMAQAIVKYYKSNQSDVLAVIQKDLYEYLLTKAPSNLSVRSELANVYIQELQFPAAQAQAKEVINNLSAIPDESLDEDQKAALASAYKALGDVSSLEKLGTQKNAYGLAARYFGESARFYKLINNKSESENMILKQVKCLQSVGTVPAMRNATVILENLLKSL